MSQIRTLQVITRLIVGGAQETVFHVAELLDRSRFSVDVWSGPQTGSEGSLIEEMRARGIALTLLPDLLRQISPAHDLLAFNQMTRRMRREKYQIVHTNSSKAGILGRMAARMAGVPVIVHTVHGWSFHDHMSPRVRRMYITLERLAARFSDAMIVVAKQDIQKGLKEGIGRPEQYHLIRSAIPLDEFDPTRTDRQAERQELGLPLDAPVLGNVGRFSAQKNPLDWVRVAGIVGRALPECCFLLVGDGPLRSEVEAALRAEGIADRTVLTGLRRDVPQIMAAIDVFLLTSLWEGLPRVIPQSMAMGLPVVANQADGTADAIRSGENGFLSEPRNIEEMAGYCLRLLQDPALRRSMGQQGQAFARQEFDVRRMVAQIEALYEDLLKRAKAR